MEKIKVTCAKCGKEFDLDKKWEPFAKSHPERLTCPDCKNGAEKATSKSSSTKSYGGYNKVSLPTDSTTILQEYRKVFDEVNAEFQSEIEANLITMEDVRQITSSVFIEMNNRKKGK